MIEVCNAIGSHHDEIEQNNLIAPIVQVCDAISGARPGARREIVESYIKRLKDLEELALAHPGVMKTYAIILVALLLSINSCMFAQESDQTVKASSIEKSILKGMNLFPLKTEDGY